MTRSHTRGEAGTPSGVLVSFGVSREKFPAEIQNVSGFSIKLWMKRGVSAGARALVEVSPGFQQGGTVLYCKADETAGFMVVIEFDRDSGRQARNEIRTEYSQPATVSEVGSPNSSVHSATTVDLSRTGIGLRMGDSLPVGALVRIVLHDSILFGEVRYCREEGRKQFRVGILVERRMLHSDDPAGSSARGHSAARSASSWILLRFRALIRKMRRHHD